MPTHKIVNSEGAKLNAIDFAGNPEREIVLLHGLAGRAREWNSTAAWLTDLGRVIALDQRGHGDSHVGVTQFTRDAYVQDAIRTIEQCCTRPVILIGQSMGGLNAFLVAAERPDLIQALMIVEASPSREPGVQQNVRSWLEAWPLPFYSMDEAQKFFGEGTLRGQTYAASLDRRDDGYYDVPFDLENMVQTMEDVETRDYWDAWEKIVHPTLIVTGEKGFVPPEDIENMLQTVPHCTHTCIPRAGHDLHLEKPEAWRQVVETFMQTLPPSRYSNGFYKPS